MTPEVKAAVDEIRSSFSGHQVDVEEEGQGGGYVIVHDVQVGDVYAPSLTWIGFLISFQYPYGDVYPHFVDGQLQRADKQPLGQGFSGVTSWRDRSVIQISRKSHRWNPALDTATTKLNKVIDWIRTR